MTGITLTHGDPRTGHCHTHAHDHLRNLRRRDYHGWQPLGFNVTRHEAVIEVHNGVDAVIHHDKENTGRTGGDIGMPAVQQDGNVMVPVQENQFFLVDNDKKGVDQLAVAITESSPTVE